MEKRDADEVEFALVLAFRFPALSQSFVPVLKTLILEDWHKQHENIASLLQKLKGPSAVDALYTTALRRFSYLEYDDSRALAVKCVWALSAIGNEAALTKLKLLSESEDAIIRENALKAAGETLRRDSKRCGTMTSESRLSRHLLDQFSQLASARNVVGFLGSSNYRRSQSIQILSQPDIARTTRIRLADDNVVSGLMRTAIAARRQEDERKQRDAEREKRELEAEQLRKDIQEEEKKLEKLNQWVEDRERAERL